MFKMGSHYPFAYLKHKLLQKEKSICQFNSWSLKVKNHLNLLMCKWYATYHCKAIDKGYNFVLDLFLIKGLHTKLWKIPKIRTLAIFQLGSLETKWHLGVGLVAKHKEYYKGESDGFPQIQAVVNIMSLCLPVVPSCTKNVPPMH